MALIKVLSVLSCNWSDFMFVTKPESQAWILKCVFCAFQAHYAVQARRSRSVTKKRKREDSVPPTSIARSRSCSRTPRDVSGLRDTKVSLCHVQLIAGGPLLLATHALRAKPPSPTVIWSRGCGWELAVCCTLRAALGPAQLGVPGSVPWLHHAFVVSFQGKQKHGVIWRWAYVPAILDMLRDGPSFAPRGLGPSPTISHAGNQPVCFDQSFGKDTLDVHSCWNVFLIKHKNC